MQGKVSLVPPGRAMPGNTPYAVPRRTAGNERARGYEQIESRRDRHVFLLVDGQHSIDEIAGILGLSAVDVACSLLRLLERGWIEMVSL